MIDIVKLHNYLNKDGNRDGNNDKNYTFQIPKEQLESGHIYGKYIMDAKYGFLGKSFIDLPEWVNLPKNLQYMVDKSLNKNTFTDSLLNVLMPEYKFFDIKSRMVFCNDLHRQIGFDMEEKSLYKDMGYVRLRKVIRDKFINNFDLDNDDKLKQIILDYFSITVYEISKTNKEKFGSKMDISKKGFVPMIWKKTERNEEYMDKNLVCFLLKLEEKYYPIVRKNTDGIFDIGPICEFISKSDMVSETDAEVDAETDAETDAEVDAEIDADIDADVEKTSKISSNPIITEPVVSKIKKISPNPIITEPVVSKIKKIKKTSVVVEPVVAEPVVAEPVVVEPVVAEPVAVITNLTKIVLPKKIGLKEIQDIAKEYGIDILKKSDKTEKMLKKTIDELRDELMEKYG